MAADDTYEALGPNMRARLDAAEMDVARVRDLIAILAERNRHANGIAAELCLLLRVARPRAWDAITAGRKR